MLGMPTFDAGAFWQKHMYAKTKELGPTGDPPMHLSELLLGSWTDSQLKFYIQKSRLS